MTKKITALLLVVIMTITMSVNVFAAQPAKFEVGKTTTMLLGETVKFTPWDEMATYLLPNADIVMMDDFGNITAKRVGTARIEQINTSKYWIIAVTNVKADGTIIPDIDHIGEFEQKVFELINKERTDRGLNALIWDDSLARAARSHSKDVVANTEKILELYGTRHRGSDGSTPTERANREGWSGGAGENITYHMMTPEDAVTWWMNSPKHKDNLLNPKYKYTGVGCANPKGFDELFTTTQDFGK